MSTVDAAIERIRAYRSTQGWNKLRLATEAGLRESVLRDMDRQGWSPNTRTLRKLEAVIPDDFEPVPAQAAEG